jgi:nitrogen fixation NifU-like protein
LTYFFDFFSFYSLENDPIFEIYHLGGKMEDDHHIDLNDPESVRKMLYCSGYSDIAIGYYMNQPNMGSLADADQVAEITGPCGDTMRVYIKFEGEIVKDVKYQVLGCPGAVASAMAAVDLIKGKPISEALALKDRDIYRKLEEIPEQKQHCIRLAVKTLQKALEEHTLKNKEIA